MSNLIIENVRRSLGRAPNAPLAPRPLVYPARQPAPLDQEMEVFLGEVQKLSGSAQKLAPQAVATALQTLVTENAVRKATLWRTPLLEQLGIATILSSLGVELVSPNVEKQVMAACDLGVTDADYLLPETGTLVLRSSLDKPRSVSLLPRIHLAIVLPHMLRPDLHQVFCEARDSHYLVFITGPSRTADIELTLTLGVHGPKHLSVWVLDNEGDAELK